MSSPSFAELGVTAPVVGALARRGITAPFAVQNLVLPDALDGRDLLVQSPTGSGKTLAFGIPIIERLDSNTKAPAAVILVPTRELAVQVGQADLAPIARPGKQLRVVGGVRRLAGIHVQSKQARDAAGSSSRRRAAWWTSWPAAPLDLRNVHTLVLDEAERMLDMGFRRTSTDRCKIPASVRRSSSRRRSPARPAGSRTSTRGRRAPPRAQSRRSATSTRSSTVSSASRHDAKLLHHPWRELPRGRLRRLARSSCAPSAAPTGW